MSSAVLITWLIAGVILVAFLASEYAVRRVTPANVEAGPSDFAVQSNGILRMLLISAVLSGLAVNIGAMSSADPAHSIFGIPALAWLAVGYALLFPIAHVAVDMVPMAVTEAFGFVLVPYVFVVSVGYLIYSFMT